MSISSEIQNELAELPEIDWETLLSTASEPYGLSDVGYLPKPYARLLAEKLALAERLLGPEIDVNRGSVFRKVIEMVCLEQARTYALLGNVVDNLTVPTASGDALSRLGEELGLPRPYLNAAGTIDLSFTGSFSTVMPDLVLEAGLRLLTPGGHHVALAQAVMFEDSRTSATVPVTAFHPGPEHNLDPGVPSQKIDRWNPADPALAPIIAAANDIAPGTPVEDAVTINHSTPLSGGEMRWPDDRYRQLLLRAPRSLWTVDAMKIAVSLVPGVRQVKLVDLQGGLDIDQSIFGTFNFGERVFGSDRDLASPYYFTVLIAPTRTAIWDGPDGLAALVAETIEDLRPIGVFPEIREAEEVIVGVRAELVVDGIPLPSGDRTSINNSPAARALKERLVRRLKGYIDNLDFGEAVSPAKITWTMLNETGIADVRNLRLTRYPRSTGLDFLTPPTPSDVDELVCDEAFVPTGDQVAVYRDDIDELEII